MTAARAFSRLTSATVIVAVATFTVLAVCCAAFGAPATGGIMPGEDACSINSPGLYALVGPSAESTKIAMALSATHGMPLLLGIAGGIEVGDALDAGDQPDSPDPRHERIRA
ncbi:MAG: hypothetical protein KJ747_04685 [Actinobacteria bacterium]|nr:hypothetical protein [Actinomycetota bacterium]MCG2808097.1 hypothetical protein [Coriobacteriia bacterium]